MKKNGFTYIEVVIAFAVFGLLFLYISKLNVTSKRINRDEDRQIDMLYTAQTVMEKYKEDPLNPPASPYEGYYIRITQREVDFNIEGSDRKAAEVTVSLSLDDIFDNDDDVKLDCRFSLN